MMKLNASISRRSAFVVLISTALIYGCSNSNGTPENSTESAEDDPVSDSNDIDNATTLNADNMDTVIAGVLDVYSGRDDFVSQMYALPGFSDDREVTDAETVDCLGGGRAILSYQENGRSFQFDNCEDGDNTLNGDITTYHYVSDWIHANNFSVSGGNQLQTLSTSRVRLFPGSWDVENLQYHQQAGSTDFTVSNASFFWIRAVNSSNAFNMSSEGSFTLNTSQLVNGQRLYSEATGLSITIPPQQVFEEYGELSDYPTTMSEVFYLEGTVEITAEDGSAITLNAATGDMATVSIELTSEGITQLSVLRNWADWKSNLRTDLVGWVP